MTTTRPFTIFPRAPTAEDQPHAQTILTIHVIHRAFQTGATIGLFTGAIRAYRASRPATVVPAPTASTPSAATTTTSSSSSSTIASKSLPMPRKEIILRSAGRSALLTTLLLTAALPPYMRYVTRDAADAADQDYAWRDRSWRLLHSESQVKVDQGSVVGMVAGAGAVVVGGGLRRGVYAAAGRVGVGSLLGVVGAEVWLAVMGEAGK